MLQLVAVVAVVAAVVVAADAADAAAADAVAAAAAVSVLRAQRVLLAVSDRGHGCVAAGLPARPAQSSSAFGESL